MNEYVTVSSSSYDPASLATKLTEKSTQGWTVVAIVPTGGDVTAFLSRSASAVAGSGSGEAESSSPAAEMHETGSAGIPEPAAAAPEPEREPAVSEPAGWAVAPEPAASTPSASSAPATVIATPMAQIGDTASYGQQQQPAAAYQPAPATAPAAVATPSVPAGWYADPAGRFELRYWDGGGWTEHVSTGGQQTTNPPTA